MIQSILRTSKTNDSLSSKTKGKRRSPASKKNCQFEQVLSKKSKEESKYPDR